MSPPEGLRGPPECLRLPDVVQGRSRGFLADLWAQIWLPTGLSAVSKAECLRDLLYVTP